MAWMSSAFFIFPGVIPIVLARSLISGIVIRFAIFVAEVILDLQNLFSLNSFVVSCRSVESP